MNEAYLTAATVAVAYFGSRLCFCGFRSGRDARVAGKCGQDVGSGAIR
jgi:hypothetical protein